MTWDIRGKTVLVTGATSGIGLSASIELARRGAELILVGRDDARLDAARARVDAAGGPRARSLRCDFTSQESIRALAAQVQAQVPRLQVLVNNAGAAFKERRLTRDGIEMTFAVNHLGYFLLTSLLEDLLARSAPARVVTVSSVSHRRGTLDLDDLGFSRGGYFIMKAYNRSKLANVLFAGELARRLADRGVTSNSLHPGRVATNIWSGAPAWAKPLIALLLRPFMLTPEQGGRFIVELAMDPALAEVSGRYFEQGRMVPPAPLAQDPALARRLWEISEQLVGL